jgi:allantoinase
MSAPAAPELAVTSERVATATGTRPAAVLIRGGTIIDVVDRAAVPPGCPVLDAGPLVVMPGIVDSHVHVNEPGRTEWEGFETATRAAAAGGVTTIVDMPLNSVPATTTLAALEAKLEAARGRLSVDCGFWGGVVPGNTRELDALVDAGAAGFKCFLVPSGVDEFPHVGECDLREALPVLAARGVPLLVHAELAVTEPEASGDPRRYAGYLASRPREWENEAVRLLVRLCRETGARVHVVHLSSSDALPLLAEARRQGLPMTVETCPHYLTFDAEAVPDGRTEFKCSPPIREHENRERLWTALRERVIDMVVSDHSPCTPALKEQRSGDFMKAWGGISSLQLGLPAVWTEARGRGFGLDDVVRWMCEQPARLAGLSGRKGRLEAGCDADLIVFDPDAELVVTEKAVKHRHQLTPYLGRRLTGVVRTTLLRGTVVYDSGEVSPGRHGHPLSPGYSDAADTADR